MRHHMRLNREPFNSIGEGTKTIELRLYDEKRRGIKPGDEIVFQCEGEELVTRVRKLHIFRSFKELYAALPLIECGYNEDNIGEAAPEDMERYYTREEQDRYGVVGIELELI